ncbi:hypothetical protein TIFTF001_026857 [Ficus carica]|uniref:Uncharacterized protein n=1 Tax=Ficus carica TaxID=3494 RepID=A0AA88DLW9_FICCA|nr:hypothetical protein TIFTF001_026857 [Ficus carica]
MEWGIEGVTLRGNSNAQQDSSGKLVGGDVERGDGSSGMGWECWEKSESVRLS